MIYLETFFMTTNPFTGEGNPFIDFDKNFQVLKTLMGH